jgi:hypothetical protein
MENGNEREEETLKRREKICKDEEWIEINALSYFHLFNDALSNYVASNDLMIVNNEFVNVVK